MTTSVNPLTPHYRAETGSAPPIMWKRPDEAHLLRRKLIDIANSAWFAYIAIFVLQLKAIWGVWRLRDLPSGDTSSYFLSAFDWFRTGHIPITWSPLYTSFYGSLLYVSNDAFTVTMLHRVIIVLVLSILVLALMRRLLPAGFAWMAAAWWVVLPIDFNSLYEVHLFALIPILSAFLAVLWKPGPWGRGLGVGILLASAFLMRNELLLAAILFAAACLWWEFRRVREGAASVPWLLRAYGTPIAAACVLIFFFYLRASDAKVIGPMMSRKHTLNMCQVYAFGYQQRYSDWQGSPWTQCQQLMTRVFGVPEPSLTEALRRNPSAMLEHFWWNVQLVPNGLQVLLLNGMTGNVNPDYVPVNRYASALPATIFIFAIVCAGLFWLYKDWHYWWDAWLKDRVWGWIAMACVSCVVPSIIITQRPRPSYLLAFGIALRAAITMCAFVLARRYLKFQWVKALAPVAAILLLAVMPEYYYYQSAPRTLSDFYHILDPFHEWIEQPGAGLVTVGWADDLCSYIGHSRGCRALTFAALRGQVTPDRSLTQVLDTNGASVFFADPSVLSDPLVRRFVSESPSNGWRLIAMRHDKYKEWELLVRSPKTAAGVAGEPQPLDENIREIADPAAGIEIGAGWYSFEVYKGASFRWANNDAEIELKLPPENPVNLNITVQDGPGLNGKPLDLQILGNGALLKKVRILGRQTVKISLPTGRMSIRLHTESENKPVPNDPRIMNFRVFRIWTT